MVKHQIIFSGAGGFYHYYLGIADVIQKYLPKNNDIVFSGISAGCFPALALALNINITDIYNTVNLPILWELGTKPFGALCNYNQIAIKQLLEFLPADSYKTANGKFRVSVTHLPNFNNQIINKFENNKDLVDAIFSSAFIPLFDKTLWKSYKNYKLIDGGISDYYGKNFLSNDYKTWIISKDMWRNTKISWFWCWTCEHWADTIYNWGIKDMFHHLHLLNEFIEIPTPHQ